MLTLGSLFGPYRIQAFIGQGGMGEVYRAHDSRLKRDVALKTLRHIFAADPDRLARFEREAQVLASLNHPHIAAIYGVEESNGTRALVMELVDGDTLADRISSGPIPLDEALLIARQIAHAIEAAHEAGIIHRDLKPANIKLRADGSIKVLDFGLAKPLNLASPSTTGADSPAITSPAMTAAGLILGTPAYMSPEQAKGREADKRSDVWAFGAVLFEMLAGRRTFAAEDLTETLALILTKDPDWAALPSETPTAIRKLLRRCLEKDRRRRLADIADARLELEDADTAHVSAPAVVVGKTHHRRWIAAATLIAMAIAAGVAWNSVGGERTPATAQFVILPPPDHNFSFMQRFLSVSPDGKRIIFVTGAVPSEFQLWVRPIDSVNAQRIEGTEGAINPIWSPDSESIAFGSAMPGRGLFKVNWNGGRPIPLTATGLPGAWSTEGVILVGGAGVRRVPETGGDATAVTTLDAAQQEAVHVPSFFLADQRRFVFEARSRDGSKRAVYIASIDDSTRTKLIDGVSSVSYSSGRIYYHREGLLMAQPFDLKRGTLGGDAVALVENVDYEQLSGAAAYSVSAAGVMAYRVGTTAAMTTLSWFTRDGKRLATLPLESRFGATRRPSLSPDGGRLAVTLLGVAGESDVWVIDLNRNVPTRFTFEGHAESAIWSQDGSRIIYASVNKGVADLYERDARGVGAARLLYSSQFDKRPFAVSRDGKMLLFGQAPTGNPEIWALPLVGEATPIPIVQTGFPAGNAVFSPDGRWFAYCEGDSGADQVYVQPFPPDGQRIRVSPTSGSSPQWSGDGKEILYMSHSNALISVDVAAPNGTLQLATPRELFNYDAAFTHRAHVFDSSQQRVLLPTVSRAGPAPITVVINVMPNSN